MHNRNEDVRAVLGLADVHTVHTERIINRDKNYDAWIRDLSINMFAIINCQMKYDGKKIGTETVIDQHKSNK